MLLCFTYTLTFEFNQRKQKEKNLIKLGLNNNFRAICNNVELNINSLSSVQAPSSSRQTILISSYSFPNILKAKPWTKFFLKIR